MATFLLDHNVTYELRTLLSSSGHTVNHTRDLQMARTLDDEILSTAARNRWILVTHNAEDFILLHHAWLRWPILWNIRPHPEHAGILVLPNTLKPPDLAKVIGNFVDTLPILANQLFKYHKSKDQWIKDELSLIQTP